MREKPVLSVDADYSVLSNTLGEFHIDKHRCLIVNLNITENFKKSPLFPMLSSPNCSEIIRFEVKDQICAVLLVNEHHDRAKSSDITTLLTGRELQIATLVASGKVNKQIASELHISEWTVSTHLRRIFAKLGVSSRAAMVFLCASLIC
jgi:DNA-binding CsgD family transcriptional regulator